MKRAPARDSTTEHRTPAVHLIHWHEGEAEERAAIIRDAGYAVGFGKFDPAALRRLRDDPPLLFIIDLSRLPSQGRDVGVRLRHTKATRHVPLIFVDGDEEKVARVREVLPDAYYTSWGKIRSAIRKALDAPPVEVVTPASAFAAFAGTPLLKKLGIKEKMRVGAVNAPDEIEEMLGDLPEGTCIERRAAAGSDLLIWFVRSRRELESDIDAMRERITKGGIWIAWPKKSAARASDLTQLVVREICSGAGLVDYKVCSIDDTWTAMRFSVRK